MSMATVRTRDSFDHWWDPEGRKNIIINRRSLRVSTKRYLDNVPLIDGIPDDYHNKYPHAAMLAETYVRLVKGELAHHNDDKNEALWTGMLFGPLFAQIWESACAVNLKALKIPTTIQAFKGAQETDHVQKATWLLEHAKKLPNYEIEDWLAVETFETAELFGQAFIKAFAEFSTVCERKGEDPIVVRHHSAILAEIISDMLNLVIQGGEPTDLRLPDSHIHKQIAIQQEKAREPSAATLRNISLGPS